MKTEHSFIFKLVILFFGLAIIFAAYIMFAPQRAALAKENYLWANVAIIYLIFMLPSLFLSIRKKTFDKRIFPLIFVWSAVSLYAMFGTALIVFVMLEILLIRVAILLQLILLFLLSIALYAAVFAGSHIASVGERELNLSSKLNLVKQKVRFLKEDVNRMNASTLKYKELEKLLDSITFLSPVDKIEAYNLEENMIEVLNLLENSLISTNNENFDEICEKLNRLYTKRKLIIG